MTTAAEKMSPAQKAWATRRAREAAREEIAIRKAGTDAPPPAGEAQLVQLFVDDARIGSGFRRFLVMDVGRRWVTLFYAPRLATLRVDRLTFDRSAKPATFNRRTLRKIVRERIDEMRRFGDAKDGVRAIARGKAALAMLRGGVS